MITDVLDIVNFFIELSTLFICIGLLFCLIQFLFLAVEIAPCLIVHAISAILPERFWCHVEKIEGCKERKQNKTQRPEPRKSV